MRKLLNLLLLSVALCLCGASTSYSTDYYVRTDGGTAAQCDGLTDAAYLGAGSGQSCAWSHPFWALEAGSPPAWKIRGGDTLFIRAGSYRIGIGAPNSSWCGADYSYDCTLPPLPSGPDAQHPTRIVGGTEAGQGCTQPPELWGTGRVWHVLDLNGTSNAVISCLEVTDHSGCVEFHSNPSVRCERDVPPFGDWASVGVEASDSSNVLLRDLSIHGLAHTGIHAGRLADWSVRDVVIAGNGWCGWDGDIYGADSNSGSLTFQHWTVEWNGCAETYPGRQPDHCWDQSHGGYGDGVGTGSSKGHWIIEDSVFRYNTSDGLDLLYVREAPSLIEIRRTRAYGNAGNPIKTAGPARIENTLIIGNCGYFAGKPFAQEMSDHCRALGNSLALSLGRGDAVTVVNSTIVGQGDCLVSAECNRGDAACDSSESVTLTNNVLQGYAEFLDPRDTACLIWDPDGLSAGRWSYNLIHNVKNNACPAGPHDLYAKPRFVNDSLSSFDGHLQLFSPAIDSALEVGGLIPNHDLENWKRPWGSRVDRGAYEHHLPGTITAPYLLLLH